jgi:hypothetical protein
MIWIIWEPTSLGYLAVMPRAMTVMFTSVLYGLPMSISLSVLITIMLVRNPRLLLHSYPNDIRAAVPPKSPAERRESTCWTAMFLFLTISFPFAAALASKTSDYDFLEAFLIAFGVAFLFNLVDWLILDWLIFCTITPGFAVVPGTARMAGYKNYAMHFRGFLAGSMLSIVLGLLIATTVILIPI